MRLIVDLHIHSKYSRATSQDMVLTTLEKAARIKGVQVLATGDFTHPAWFKELQEQLVGAEEGLYQLKTVESPVRFILSAEVSCIYSKGNKVRRIHLLIIVPDFKTAEGINKHLGLRGNLKSDGRPILGLDAKEVAQIVFSVNPQAMLVPGHIWTPWFSLFGSKSGFNTLEECFEEYADQIFALETGLSSDPAMNWRISALDKMALLSNSDSHSPSKIGREANVFDIPLGYTALKEAIKNKDPRQFLYTIEFFPEEGKYHYDGHSSCSVSFSPEQTKKLKGICSVCHKPLTIGVLNRVAELADRPEGFKPLNAIPFKNMIPLEELIAEALDVGVHTKAVAKNYQELIQSFGNEFRILEEIPQDQLEKVAHSSVVQAVMRMRAGQVHITPGYDGVYGKIKIFSPSERAAASPQRNLF